MKMHRLGALSAAVSLALLAMPAHAVLERVGPVSTSPSIGGYPAWYQDTTGVVLEFCDPQPSELADSWCLLAAEDVPVAPEVFPSVFADEHFYFAADASVETRTGGEVQLGLAVEAAFVGDVVPGGQIVFSRIRVRFNDVPVTGTYRFIHPYGVEEIHAQAGERIFFSDDIGINCEPGNFECATHSRLGPFLLPANTPGGAELPPVAGPAPGKLYIASPDRLGPVTGSPHGTNVFRIEGPQGSGIGIDPVTNAPVDWIETTNFSLMGRVYQGPMPGRVDVSRASYERDERGTKLDVLARAFPTTQGRLPGQPRQTAAEPQLSFFGAPCVGVPDERGTLQPPFSAPVGVLETPMVSSAGRYWAQTLPASVPEAVCVKDGSARDAAGFLVPTYVPHPVSDLVTIGQAFYDPTLRTLAVSASSSDSLGAPTLTLAYDSVLAPFTGATVQLPDVVAPPSRVQVLSSHGGVADLEVRTGFIADAPNSGPVAANDQFAVEEDSPGQVLDVLANDDHVDLATVTITSMPRFGTAVANPDGTVTFTPFPDASGTDGFAYIATVGSLLSNAASVVVAITPVNDAPEAVGDTLNTLANVAVSRDVASNDIDADGNADIVALANLTPPVGDAGQSGATVSATGRTVTFSATSAGSYTFTYQAVDTAGVTSANEATVTVQVSGAEVMTFTRAEFMTRKNRLRAEGTLSPAAEQLVTVEFTNDAGQVLGPVAGVVATTAAGGWALDTEVPLPVGATRLRATSSNGTVTSQTLRLKS